ncbi:hypothetical protein DPMN_119924 [Dreissena polymorpha]|uniref:Uncharacterized protein n=1 Tax=Dreissena polymorpha TaxID=45954 RepID=A0A9D4GJN2_DREPO|nr:hypothetical protein DPMN_119924 [Dreissena polymorpha]
MSLAAWQRENRSTATKQSGSIYLKVNQSSPSGLKQDVSSPEVKQSRSQAATYHASCHAAWQRNGNS